MTKPPDTPKDEPSEDSPEDSNAGIDLSEVLKPEVMEKLPPEVQRTVTNIVHQQREQQLYMNMPMLPPFMEKIDGEHLGSLIANDEKENSRSHSTDRIRMILLMVGLIVVLGFVLLLSNILSDKNPDLLQNILIYILIYAGGIGTGLGAKRVLSGSDAE